MSNKLLPDSTPDVEASLSGCLLGTAVGDALGLPREGLPAARARRLYGAVVRPQLLFRRAMVSDDTEHALMTACALLEAGRDVDRFSRALARRLRRWLLLLPAAAGKATLTACLRLLLGVSPQRSGSFSAGNGPMMRAPIIGVYLAHDLERMREFVRITTRITHTDPKAERAAQIVAWAAGRHLRKPNEPDLVTPEVKIKELLDFLPEGDPELQDVLTRAADPAPLDTWWPKGPTGYAYHTLLAVLHTWLQHPGDYAEALEVIVGLGGDTDTTAAVLGAIMGAELGAEGVPSEWLKGLWEWPRGIAWMRETARALADSTHPPAARCPRWHCGLTLLRNLLFLLVVLGHGFYRLFRLGGRV